MTDFSADAVLQGLKGFQRDAVDHVIDRFYGAGAEAGTGRFLVADETGLGKSIVARGVVARAIEELQRNDDIDRIDVVYICSNQDLATQNLRRLNVTGDDHISMATRLTLLARESARLNQPSTRSGKKVNLVSFTPGTSFKDGGWRTGSVEERAMLVLILDRLVNTAESERRSTRLLLQGAVRTLERFSWRVDQLAAELERLRGPDERIVASFHSIINDKGMLAEFLELRDAVKGRHAIPGPLWHQTMDLIARLRQALAKASVDALEPDLVILDEFQRFRHLLDPSHSDAADLADGLFSYEQAKVLLLSATPYKPYTTRGETDDDHARDFLETIRFLSGRDESIVQAVQDAFRAHREALVAGDAGTDTAVRVRDLLLPLMSRSERPPLGVDGDMVVERPLDGGSPRAEEIADWAALERLGDHLGVRIDLEHWKSIPYFATFMESYKPGSRTRELLERDGGRAIAPLLAAVSGVERAAVEHRQPIDLGNGMLRALAADTLDRGWWKLLWMPPTMPYLEPGPIYSSVEGDVTKHVVFSAWSGVPTAISALLSHEAERLATGPMDQSDDRGGDAGDVSRRLNWAVVDGIASRMSTLSLFWPHPALVDQADPLQRSRANGGLVEAQAVAQLPRRPHADAGEAWTAFFSTAGSVPAGADAVDVAVRAAHATDVEADELQDGGNLATYVRRALDATGQHPSHHPELGILAAHSPGSIAYRALRSVASDDSTESGIWAAAWRLSLALRSLFDRPDTTALLNHLYRDTEMAYWRMILEYCADGNLQATLDEYLFQIKSEFGGQLLEDAELMAAADTAANAIRLTTASLRGHDTTAERGAITFRTRFAVRYGGAHTDADEKVAARQSDVRTAFNSPFAPFVLASTSVGQEGIDFHWWSHAVVHWNLPSNPVDFEQREGRVHRFLGHAVRKNVVAEHWPDLLASDSSAWDAAFAAAERAVRSGVLATETKLGEFAPWWVYPGPHRIQRRVASLTLSRNHARYARLVDALTLYRLTLGQPRQEDMVRLLEQRQLDPGSVSAIHLHPPARSRE